MCPCCLVSKTNKNVLGCNVQRKGERNLPGQSKHLVFVGGGDDFPHSEKKGRRGKINVYGSMEGGE